MTVERMHTKATAQSRSARRAGTATATLSTAESRVTNRVTIGTFTTGR